MATALRHSPAASGALLQHRPIGPPAARAGWRIEKASDPVYAPNSKGGPEADGERHPRLEVWGASGDFVHAAYDDDFGQAGTLVRKVMDGAQRDRLVSNVVGHLKDGAINRSWSRGMIGRPSGLRRLDPFEPKLGKIERFDERVDHPNWIVFVDPVFQTFRKERRLAPIHPLDKALHPIPRELATESYRGTRTRWGVFTQPGS
jgi:hypothetical protein